jgi:broad specificity phosphatase PhoE
VQQRALEFTHIFSSDLTRARLTADAILEAQVSKKSLERIRTERIVLEVLREQDFGSFECQPWLSKSTSKGEHGKLPDSGQLDFKPKETQAAMVTRMNTFLNETIHPLLAADLDPENIVAVVSHGITLSVLWRTLLERFGTHSVSLGSEVGVSTGSRPLQSLPVWSNTGYLELEIKPAPVRPDLTPPLSMNADLRLPGLSGHQMLIRSINRKDHLNNLKRTRGGLGSAAFDAKQKNLEGFFKRPKIDGQNPTPD